MSLEFKAWPKTPRLNRDMIITEKIDGTNSAVIVMPDPQTASPVFHGSVVADGYGVYVETKRGNFVVAAQSRKRLIKPGKTEDNAGFAAWVRDNAQDLAAALGEGHHYGEWYGEGIQKNRYQVEGIPADGTIGKRFALFNVVRYNEVDFSALPSVRVACAEAPQVHLVPILYEGPFDQGVIMDTVEALRVNGSYIAPQSKAEGVIVFHKAAGHVYKVMCENDELPKGIVPKIEREASIG